MDTLAILERKSEIIRAKIKENDKKYKAISNDLKYRGDKYTAKQLASKKKKLTTLLKRNVAYIKYDDKLRAKMRIAKEKDLAKRKKSNPFAR